VDDLGPPIAYTVLREGTPVYDPSGERVGLVEEVVADMTTDIFDGVVIHTVPLLPGHHLFAAADQIAELHERGVVLSVERDALHDQGESGGKRRAGDREKSPLEARLARAWDRIAKRH
jgi:uncharacterized protein YrrD